ncbi:MAG: hypothetical protein WAN92_07335 [Herbaspirillum sp.]
MRELSISELELVSGAACREFVISTMDYVPGAQYGSRYSVMKVCDDGTGNQIISERQHFTWNRQSGNYERTEYQ